MLSADSHSVSLGQGHGHAHGHGHVRFFNSGPGASSGSHSQGYDHDHSHSNAVAPTQLQQHHHHHHHHYNHHIQGHGLAAFPPPTSSDASSSTGALAPPTAQVARLVRNHASPLTRTRSAPPRALALPASAQQQPGSAAVADNGHPRQPPKKKLRPSHPLPLSTSTSSSTPTAAAFRVPAVHRPLPITGVSANYDADAFARLAVGARSGYATRPPVVDAGMAAASAMAVTVVDRRVQAQAVRRMRERAVERAGVVQWLVHLNAIHASFRFAPETIYTGVQYMDRALASSPTARKHLAPRKPHMYLLAVVCLTLAAKFAEEYAAPSVAGILAALAAVPPPPAAAGVVQALMPAWTQKHVLAMERKVLEALHFDLAAVAPSAAVFELLFANVDLAVELCALVMSGGQSAGVSPTVATPRSSPMSTSPAASSAAPPAAAGFLSPGASPRSSGSSTSSAGMVPPSPVSPTGAFDHEVFMAPPHMHTSQSHQQHQASRTSFGIAAAARPFPPPIAPPAHVSSAAQAKWTMYSAPGPTDLAQDQPDAAAAAADADAGDLSPMDVDPSPADHGMCMVTPPHTPPRAPAAAGSGSPARSSTPSDERWPAALSSPTHRNLIARLVRAVQTELVQRVLVHAQGTAHAPLNTAVVLLNRAVVCLAAANKAAAAVSMPAGGTGLDPSPMATPGATGTVTVSGTGAAVAQVAGIVSRVQCVVTEERGRGEWGACVEMVRQAVGGQVVGLAA